MLDRAYTLPLEMLYQREEHLPHRVYLRQPYPGKGYQELTWEQALKQIRSIAAVLKQKGLPPGSPIAILSKNCAHWIMADYAIWMAGHVSVPLYPNLNEESARSILAHSDCKLAFVGKLDHVAAYRSAVPAGVPCIAFPYQDVKDAELWDDLVATTPPLTGRPSRGAQETATIIYTSGTTGESKGVMHSFQSIAIAGTEVVRTEKPGQGAKFFSYLPMAHVSERIIVQTAALYAAGVISFVESLETFQKNIQSVQPTVFVAVPRLWHKFQLGVLEKVPQKKLTLLLSIPIISYFVRRKIKKGLGLASAKIIISGGAATPAALVTWFRTIGIVVQEAYGMTENFAYSHYNRHDKTRPTTVGTPWPGVKARISPEGEIQVASPCSFQGYYKRQAQRAEMFDGEYLKTGDRGTIDPDGYLTITGRLKDIFKTSKGKYVAPAPIEAQISESVLVESVCVVGAELEQPMALVTLAPGAQKEGLESTLQSDLEKINASLSPHERLSRIVIVKGSWTTENAYITPTLKVKRSTIEEKYADRISQWAKSPQKVVWEA